MEEPISSGSDLSWRRRESLIPLPGPQLGYSVAMLLGATGAGKTSLVRQLIGTDPRRERFPAVSAGRTTIFDTEIILAPGAYRAVVTFLAMDQVRAYVEECVVRAFTASLDARPDPEIAQQLLESADQQFRLYYVLGRYPAGASAAAEISDSDEEEEEPEEEEPGEEKIDRRALDEVLRGYLRRVKVASGGYKDAFRRDREAFLQGFRPRKEAATASLIEDLIKDISVRFNLAQGNVGSMVPRPPEWPTHWAFESQNRPQFLRALRWFSSNQASEWGRLLTPLVSGLRVMGAFKAAWMASIPKLVVLDGEGLGQRENSAFSLPTSITRRFDQAQAIVLVDNAQQPLLPGPKIALRAIASGGHEDKLAYVFTHMDLVKGDDLPDDVAKRQKVLGALHAALEPLDEHVGTGMADRMRNLLGDRVFFLGGVNRTLSNRMAYTRGQLQELVKVLVARRSEPPASAAKPTYRLADSNDALSNAARKFQERWGLFLDFSGRTGAQPVGGGSVVVPLHWTVGRALTRRLGYMGLESYGELKPVGDMVQIIAESIRDYINKPAAWSPMRPSQPDIQRITAQVAQEFYSRLHVVVIGRLWQDKLKSWRSAHDLAGPGSGNARKLEIRRIAAAAAAWPEGNPEALDFIMTIQKLLQASAQKWGANVI